MSIADAAIMAEREQVVAYIEAQVEWVLCDCGCDKNKPATFTDVKLVRLAAAVRMGKHAVDGVNAAAPCPCERCEGERFHAGVSGIRFTSWCDEHRRATPCDKCAAGVMGTHAPRLLTFNELLEVNQATHSLEEFQVGIQRKFCEVNGLTHGVDVPREAELLIALIHQYGQAEARCGGRNDDEAFRLLQEVEAAVKRAVGLKAGTAHPNLCDKRTQSGFCARAKYHEGVCRTFYKFTDGVKACCRLPKGRILFPDGQWQCTTCGHDTRTAGVQAWRCDEVIHGRPRCERQCPICEGDENDIEAERNAGVAPSQTPSYPQRWQFPGVPVEPQPSGVPARPPCAVCGTPYEKHGTAPTCASHNYTDGGHIVLLVPAGVLGTGSQTF
jgi:hypothetical protein